MPRSCRAGAELRRRASRREWCAPSCVGARRRARSPATERQGSADGSRSRSADRVCQPRGPAHSVRRPGHRAPPARCRSRWHRRRGHWRGCTICSSSRRCAASTLRAHGLTAVEESALGLLTRAPVRALRRYIRRIALAPGRPGQLARTVKLADLDDHLGHARMPPASAALFVGTPRPGASARGVVRGARGLIVLAGRRDSRQWSLFPAATALPVDTHEGPRQPQFRYPAVLALMFVTTVFLIAAPNADWSRALAIAARGMCARAHRRDLAGT